MVMAQIRVARTHEMTAEALATVSRLMDAAFEDAFTADDWDHSLGGWHVLAFDGDDLLAHGSLVERRLFIDDVPVRAGYVEAVGTDPAMQGNGLGTAVMEPIGAIIAERFDLGALSTSAHGFYERLGWERWQGRTYVRHQHGAVRTPDEDDGIMVLRTTASISFDLTASIACEPRSGDDW